MPVSNTDTSPAEALAAVRQYFLNLDADRAQFRDWAGGTPEGGPNNDGTYPLTDFTGNVHLYPCPAKIATVTDEQIRDAIGTSIGASGALNVVVDDVANTITFSIDEATDAQPGSMSAADKAKLDDIEPGATAYTDEMVRDVMGVALNVGPGIGVTVNDAGDTITFTNLFNKRLIPFFFKSGPLANEVFISFTPAVGETITFADNFAGATGKKLADGVNPTADYTFSVKKNGANVGTIIIDDITGVVSFVTTGATVTIIGGTDILEIVGQATADATLFGYTFTLVGAIS